MTKREKEVLKLIAEGLTNAEISEKLFISVPTVNTHRKSLLEKFEVKNPPCFLGRFTGWAFYKVCQPSFPSLPFHSAPIKVFRSR
ncbi:MAG: helix-turn-helix transcriptional regulator, partial [Cyclobacteriaceae bacterium]|nr:helix-turn-helix transcriptional regulator [Cyclobacteriaceae bacterium]